MLFDHQNMGIDTSYVQIMMADIWYKMSFLVMTEHFAPIYHFRIILTKVPPYIFS